MGALRRCVLDRIDPSIRLGGGGIRGLSQNKGQWGIFKYFSFLYSY